MKDKGMEFSQVDRPSTQSEELVDTNVDYTKESDLRALLQSHTMLPEHKVQTELLLSISCSDFYDLYLEDRAEFGFEKHLQFKQELNIQMSSWQDPTAED